MSNPLSLHGDYNRIEVVQNIDAILSPDFKGSTNCLLFRCTLSHDFNALAKELKEWTSRGRRRWAALTPYELENEAQGMNSAAREAANFILNHDMRPMLAKHFKNVHLRVIDDYGASQTLNFHGDKYTVVCRGYNGPMTEYVRNEDVTGWHDVGYGALYDVKPGALTDTFNPGDIWCQAGTMEKGIRDAFPHRGVNALPDNNLRLLLMGEPT